MAAKISSPSLWIDKVGLKKLGKGSLIAGAGAILTYIANDFGILDFGSQWTPIVVAGLSIAVNALRKLLVKYE